MAFKAVDLFSGSGGLTEGLKQAGFEVIGAVECYPLAAETYQKNHSEVVLIEDDIRNVEPEKFREKLGLKPGKLDLLAGCPPCEGFSSLRTLNGSKKVSDSRNELIFEFLEFVKELVPKTILVENVPALADDERIEIFKSELKEMGYDPKLEVKNAEEYGVPQRRNRMILVAGKHHAPKFAEKTKKRRTVREAIGHLPKPGDSGDPLHDVIERRTDRIKKLIKKIPRDGGGRTDLPESKQLDCHKKMNGFKDVYGRMAWDDVAPTITGGCVNPSKGRFLHPEQDRAVTPREAALLQSFPPNYYFSMRRGKMKVAELIGDALPPEFVRKQALEIEKTLQALSVADSGSL